MKRIDMTNTVFAVPPQIIDRNGRAPRFLPSARSAFKLPQTMS